MTTIEEWRSVPGHDLLEISSIGRVRSKEYQTPMPNGGVKTNKLNPTFGNTCNMSDNYSRKIVVFRRKTYKIATMVAAAFLGPRPDGYDVSHKDEDSHNNIVDNLAYETRKENLNKLKVKEYHKRVCIDKMLSRR